MRIKARLYAMVRNRTSLLFLSLAAIFLIPAMLIVCNPLIQMTGIEPFCSAVSNMSSATDGQEGAMAAAGTAAAAAAGASASSPGKGNDDDVLAPLVPDSGADAGTGEDAGSKKGDDRPWQRPKPKLQGDDASPVTPLNPETSQPLSFDDDGEASGGPPKSSDSGSKSGGDSSTGSPGNSGDSGQGKGTDSSDFRDWFGIPKFPWEK